MFVNFHITNLQPLLGVTKGKLNIYTMAPPDDSVPSTLDARFLPTLSADNDALFDHYILYQSISMQEPYKNYSPEELRWADLARLPGKPKTACQLKEELEQKSSEIGKLQLQMEQLQQQLNEGHEQKASELGQLREQLNAVTQELEQKSSETERLQAKVTQLTQEKKALEESLESTLKSRSDKMKTALNKKLKECREALEAELLPSVENARQEGRAEGLEEGRTLGLTESQAQGRKHDELSEREVRELLSTNPTVKNILASNIKKKLAAETAKIEAEYEAKLKVYKLSLSGQLGNPKGSPARNLLTFTSPVGSSKPSETISAPKFSSASAGNVQPSTIQSTSTTAANYKLGPTRSSKPSRSGVMTAPPAKTVLSSIAPVIKPTTAGPQASDVKATSLFERSASVPPKSSTFLQGPVAKSPFSFTKSFDSSNIFGQVETPESNKICGPRISSEPSHMFGCSNTPSKSIFPSISTRAQSTPFDKPIAAATVRFGSASPFQPSNTVKPPATFATAGLFGVPSSNSFARKPASNYFGSTNSSGASTRPSDFNPFAQKPVESKDSNFASPSIFSFAPKNYTTSPFLGSGVSKTEANVQKRDREEEMDRDKGDLKKGRVGESKKENE